MERSRILLVYGTSYGQTAKIAERIAARLRARGVSVRVARGDSPDAAAGLDEFDAVVVGASLIIGGYQRYIRRFVRAHAAALNGVPSAFFAVSGSEGGDDEDAKADALRVQRRFLDRHGWHPAFTASFAGAVAYTKYGPLVRRIMKRISRRAGGSTDTTRDHEYTDWGRVDAFADEVMALAGGARTREVSSHATGGAAAELPFGRRWWSMA